MELVQFLKENELTKELSDPEIQTLLPFIEVKTYEEGTFLFKEGDEGRELFLVKNGSLEVLKEIEKPQHLQQLGVISTGEFFGEMAHLENEKRSASVKTLEKVEVLSLNLDRLQGDKAHETLYAKILAKIAKSVSKHLRETDRSLIETLGERLKRAQAYAQTSKTLIYFVILMTVWFNLSTFINQFPAYRQTLDLLFTSSLLVLFVLSAIILVRTSEYPLEFYGLTLKNWLKVSLEAIGYTLPIMAFFFVLKWLLVNYVNIYRGNSIFTEKKDLPYILTLSVVYVVLAVIQEFIARGCIQSCFRNFFQGEHRVFKAILFSNLSFQILHTVKEFWLGIASLFLGFFWGYLFEKQKSLVGVSISHALIGMWAFFILDFDTLIEITRNLAKS